MHIDILREFSALAQNLNFTHTAAECHITQSVLSRHIAALEKELGVDLLIRSSRGARLSPFGESFSQDVKTVLEAYDAALEHLNRLKNDYSRPLRVGYLFGAAKSFLSPTYALLNKLHPDIVLRLTSIEGGQLMNKLETNEIDLAIAMTSNDPNPSWYNSYQIYDDYFGAIISDTHPLASKTAVDLDDLSGNAVCIFASKSFKDPWNYLYRALSEHNPNLQIKDIVYDAYDMPILAQDENVASIAPSHLVFKLDMTGMTFLPIRNPRLGINIKAVWKKSKESPALLAFVECVKEITGSMSTEQLRNAL